MKAHLWGGPHDGLVIDVDKNCLLLRMPVTTNVEAMSKPVDVLSPVPLVARYVRTGESNRFLYASQEKM